MNQMKLVCSTRDSIFFLLCTIFNYVDIDQVMVCYLLDVLIEERIIGTMFSFISSLKIDVFDSNTFFLVGF